MIINKKCNWSKCDIMKFTVRVKCYGGSLFYLQQSWPLKLQ